jgi:hypothetical protein
VSEESPDGLQYPEWQSAVQEALLEFRADSLQEKIAVAEAAISSRLQQLALLSDSKAEQQAIQDALNLLRVLKERRARSA